jgi:predicted permease
VDALFQDLRHSLRFVRKNPGFSLLVALTLGLGIGANASIFSLLDQVLVRRLGVRNPQELVLLSDPGPNTGMTWNSSYVTRPFSHPMFVDIRDRNQVFSGVLARCPMPLTLGYRGTTESVEGSLVSGTYFDVLGVGAEVGRVLTAADDRTPGAHPVAVLGYGAWQRRFGGDPGVVGESVTVNGQPLTVVGVAARGFRGIELGRTAEVFVPLMMKAQVTPLWNGLGERRMMWLQVMARLAPGMTIERAQAPMDVLYRQILEDEAKDIPRASASFLERFVEKKPILLPGTHGAPEMQSLLKTPLVVLMGMVGLVVLIACANVAGLLLARASSRQREIALRLALGATRGRVARQLLVEGFVLSLLGAAAGLVFATWTTGLLIRLLPFAGLADTLSAEPDWRVAGFAVALAALTTLLVGLAPAVQSTRPDLVRSLKEQAGSLAGGAVPLRLRKGLVVAQVALSALLLTGAGLFARSLDRLRGFDPGFRTEHLLTFSIDPVGAGRTPEESRALYARVRDRLLELPGISNVTMASEALMTDSHNVQTVHVEGYTRKEDEDTNPNVAAVGPTFLKTMGMRLLAGRDLEESDGASAPKVAVVNETFARYFFGTKSPIGRHFGWSRDGDLPYEIVGVVQDARTNNLRETIPRFIYVPYLQYEDVPGLIYYARTASDPLAFASSVRDAVRGVDPGVPIADLRTMTATIDESLFIDRIIASLSAGFSLLATVLAGIGLYGVMSFAVARRTREIGLRVALGADRARILRLVLVEVAMLAGIGVAIGLPGGWGLGKLVQSRLFEMGPMDLPSAVGAFAVVVVATLLAGTLPALRAMHVEPATALRDE